MKDHISEAISQVIGGQSPKDVLEGTLRQRSLIVSKSRSSLSAGGPPVRKLTVSRDAGWTHKMAAEGDDAQETEEILKAVRRKGTLEVIPPTSDYPVAHITLTGEGYQFTVMDPADSPMGLAYDPEIRAAQRLLANNPTNLSEARKFIHLLVTKVKYANPLAGGLAVA